MKRIILDTNFLLIPAQFRVDIFSEINRICSFSYELVVLDKTIDELNSIVGKQKGRNKAAARLALKLLKAKKVKVVKTENEGSVDEIIPKTITKDDVIATQDKALKKKILKKGSKVIILRQKKYLEMV